MGYLDETGLAALVGKVKGQMVELTAEEYAQIDPAIKNYDNKLYFVKNDVAGYQIDNEPVANSEGLVKSGGIYNWTSKIGSGTLITTAQTLIPAVNEVKNDLDDLSDTTAELESDFNTIASDIDAINGSAVLQFLSTGWAEETVDSETYFTQSITVTQVFSEHPSVGIVPISGTLPTANERTAYDLVTYFTANDTTNVIKAYATSEPETTFAVVVKGVSNA